MRSPTSFRFSLMALALVLALAVPAAMRAVRAQAPQVQVLLTLPKDTYLYWEEIPLRITITNTGLAAEPLRLPEARASVDFEVVDAVTGRPAVSTIKRRGPRPVRQLHMYTAPPVEQGRPSPPPPKLKLQKTAAHASSKHTRAQPMPAGKQAEPRETATGPKSRSAPRTALLAVLGPGESAVSDYELLEKYGTIQPGRYALRGIYATEGATVTTEWIPFVVQPLPPAEQEAMHMYRRVMDAPDNPSALAAGADLLRRFPHSIFVRKAGRRMLEAASGPNGDPRADWETAAQLAQWLRQGAVWHGEYNALGMFLAKAWWHLGYRAEAEALMRSNPMANPEIAMKNWRKAAEKWAAGGGGAP
ncbi:MAG: hypothetical protein HY321_20275 [Armatimonadetes bacterium]|nr:hypothetical protein [Armatimonadota bacterium]